MAGESGFADRLAYVRWLRARGRRAPETDAEFAEAVGVTYGWLSKWKLRPDAPEGRTETGALTRALGPNGVTSDWLFDGKGSAPEPEQWKRWIKELPRHHGETIKRTAKTARKQA